jgi:calcium-dependent protein kinase
MGCLCSTSSSSTLSKKPILQLGDLSSILVTKEQDIVISPASFVKQNKAEFYKVYSLDRFPLGSGARGEVRICKHKKSKVERVVKIISKAAFGNSLSSDEVFEEVNILKNLDHPNLPRVYEFFEDPTHYFIVLEYCKGGDLFDRIIKMKNFQEAQAAEIMSQLLAGVNYLHSKGVFHRDIKPENILLDNQESLMIKLIDFDTATLFAAQKNNQKFGTVNYMAPEVVKGKYNEKCDLWSCGIVMFVLLTGCLPFDGSDEEIFQILKNVDIRLESMEIGNMSESAKDLLQKLLTSNPAERISASEACIHPWITHYSKTASKESMSRALNGIRRYKQKSKLKEAIHTFIVSKIIDSSEFLEEKEVFQSIDTNKDGIISKEELTEAIVSESVPTEEAIMYTDLIFEQVDTDHNGFIDYSEFLKATVKKTKVLNEETMLRAFKHLDKDGNGTIEIDELKECLTSGFEITKELLEDIMKQADKNGDGKIDLQEFESLLLEQVSRSGSSFDPISPEV